MSDDPPSVTDEEEEPLSERRLLLLQALREAEAHGQVADPHRIARVTGYPETAIRTWFAKRLDGVLVFRHDAASPWRVKGALEITPEEFGRRLAQRAAAPNDVLRTEDAWRSTVRKLLYEGQRRHYTLTREELELVEGLVVETTDPRRDRPRTEEVPIQPSLFPKG